jgi:hypothetical protein
MIEQWKRWECPVCRVTYDDPWATCVTTCEKGHMILLGFPHRDEIWVWAELDDHFYTKEQIAKMEAR